MNSNRFHNFYNHVQTQTGHQPRDNLRMRAQQSKAHLATRPKPIFCLELEFWPTFSNYLTLNYGATKWSHINLLLSSYDSMTWTITLDIPKVCQRLFLNSGLDRKLPKMFEVRDSRDTRHIFSST